MILHQAHNSLSLYNYNAFFYTDKIWEHHFHKNLELIYVIKGAVNCIINNVNYRLTDRDLGLCLSYDIHSYIPEKNTEYWVLVFSEDYIRYLSKQLFNKTGSGFKFRCNSTVESFIKQQIINNTKPTTLQLKASLYAVLEEYLNNIQLIDKKNNRSHIVSVISDYIMENHTKNITLKDLANKIGYDYSYMSRFFRNSFNMTFSDFVNIYRLETSIFLLENTDESITSVALESGFQSVRTFNDFFKKNTNMSPSKYRKCFSTT